MAGLLHCGGVSQDSISDADLTGFLSAAGASEGSPIGPAFELVYDELRRIAGKALAGERAGHTLQPTAIVHEVWLKLRDQLVGVRERDHVIALSVLAMRRILIDHARSQRAQKRGGGGLRLTLHEAALGGSAREFDGMELADALARLAETHERAARVFELRVYGGLPHESVASLLGVSEVTVRRDWKFAQLWMLRELVGPDAPA